MSTTRQPVVRSTRTKTAAAASTCVTKGTRIDASSGIQTAATVAASTEAQGAGKIVLPALVARGFVVRVKARVFLAVVCVLLAGCGSSHKAAKAGTPTSSSTSTTTNAASAADKQAAEVAALKLSDFPSGWTSTPHKDDPGSKTVGDELAKCLKIKSLDLSQDKGVSADSPGFSSPDSQEVQNTVAIAPRAQQVAAVMDVLAQSNAPDCLRAAFEKGFQENLKASGTTLPKGTTIGKLSVSPESFGSLGDRMVAYRVEVPVQANGVNVSVFADFVFVQRGRAFVVLEAADEVTPFPTSMSESLVRKVLTRLPPESRA
jgi:hypothetical protein